MSVVGFKQCHHEMVIIYYFNYGEETMNAKLFFSLLMAYILCLSASATFSYAKNDEAQLDNNKYILLNDDSRNQFGLSAESASLASGGSWSATELGPTIYQRGSWRNSPVFDAPVAPPSNTTISYLSWQWSVVNYTSGLLVQICNYPITHCLDVKSLGVGGTHAWDGWPATTNFVMRFGVAGSGIITPYIYGQNDTINVSWQE